LEAKSITCTPDGETTNNSVLRRPYIVGSV